MFFTYLLSPLILEMLNWTEAVEVAAARFKRRKDMGLGCWVVKGTAV